MKMRTLRFAGFALFASLLLLLAGCSSGLVGAAKSGGTSSSTTAVTIQLPAVNPSIFSAISKATTKASSSRAFMFMSYYYVYATDANSGTYYYPTDANGNTLYPVYVTGSSSQGPGSTTSVTIQLPPDHSYNFYVTGYNTNENSYSPTASGSVYNMYISSMQTNPKVNISLTPYSPIYLSYYSGSTYTTQVLQSVNNSAAPKEFVSTGGEKWFSFSPWDNTVSVTITPTSGFVFAALYDSNGRWLSAGISPNFPSGIGGTNSFTINAGVTPYNSIYIGLFDTSMGTVANTSGAMDSVSVTINSPTLVDDMYENNDTQMSASYISSPSVGMATVLTNLKAYDQDWYEFYVSSPGYYTVSALNTEVGVYGGGLQLMGPNNFWSDWTQDGGQTPTPHEALYTTGSVYLSSPGYYYIDVGLQLKDPNYTFPMTGGDYTLTVSTP